MRTKTWTAMRSSRHRTTAIFEANHRCCGYRRLQASLAIDHRDQNERRRRRSILECRFELSLVLDEAVLRRCALADRSEGRHDCHPPKCPEPPRAQRVGVKSGQCRASAGTAPHPQEDSMQPRGEYMAAFDGGIMRPKVGCQGGDHYRNAEIGRDSRGRSSDETAAKSRAMMGSYQRCMAICPVALPETVMAATQ